MSQAAGNIDIELKLKSGQYTAAMKEAQREAAKFGGGMKSAGHSSVTSVQAVSASLRTLHGGFEQNLRSMERWVAQSKTATMVAKAMFPIVGAATFGFMIGEIGMKVADFIKKANAMPKAIQQGFASMHLAAMSSTDALRLTNDQLQNAINKLQGKSQNNLAIQIDEARIAADKLATSLENDYNKVKALLKENNISGLATVLGKAPTSSVSGSVNSWNDQLRDLSYQKTQRLHEGNTGAAGDLDKQINAMRQKALAWAADQLKVRDNAATFQGNVYGGPVYQDMAGDQTGNRNILRGFQNVLQDQTDNQTEETRHTKLAPQKANLDAQKAGSEAAKKAATERVAAMQTNLDAMKLQYNMSIKATYDFWELKKSTELAGGTAYNDIVKKQSELAVQAATQAHEKIQKAIADAKRNSAEDSTTGPALINQSAKFMQGQAVKTGSEKTQEVIDTNQLAMDQAGNHAREKEAQLTDEAGKSISRYAAATQIANVHTQEYITTQVALQAILDARKDDQNANPSKENERAVTAAQIALANSQTQRGLQITSDAKNALPPSTSMTAGFDDAINDFVNASRDGAEQMRSLVTNTLQGLNNQIVDAVTGGKTNFKQFGLGVTRNIAGTALEKGEGKIMSAFGGGKLGTKGNPMYTISDDKGSASGVASVASGLMSKAGGVPGFLGGMLKSFLPFLATGGPIAGPAIVGEQGPELFIPSGSGTIIPNHQLATSAPSTSGGNISYSIDARGTDPVQTEQRVRSAIVASHQSAVSQSVKQVQQQSARQPVRR